MLDGTPNTTNEVGKATKSLYPVTKLLGKIEKSYDPGKYILVESAKSDKENNKSGKSNNSIAGKNNKLSFSLAPDKERKPALF